MSESVLEPRSKTFRVVRHWKKHPVHGQTHESIYVGPENRVKEVIAEQDEYAHEIYGHPMPDKVSVKIYEPKSDERTDEGG